MPGPGAQINSLMDLVQQQPSQAPSTTFTGTYDPSVNRYSPGVSLYSGGAGPGGGAGGFNPPPNLAQYFDPFGNPQIDDPRKVAADAGISVSDLARGLAPASVPGRPGRTGGVGYEYPNDQGGFFRIEDVFGLTKHPGPPVGGPMMPGGRQPPSTVQDVSVPAIMNFAKNAPSTNNWRLLGKGPGWIMRNGFVINAHDPYLSWGGPGGVPPNYGNSGEQSIPSGVGYTLGSGAGFGLPTMAQVGLGQPIGAGWPGGGFIPMFPGNS